MDADAAVPVRLVDSIIQWNPSEVDDVLEIPAHDGRRSTTPVTSPVTSPEALPARLNGRSPLRGTTADSERAADQAVDPAAQRALVIAVARAHAWLDALEDGRYANVAALAEAVGTDPSFVRWMLNLTLLAPR